MYCKYKHNSSATQASITDDIFKLVTGETDLNNLSSGCDVAGSELVIDIPAGWVDADSFYDSTSNLRIVKAPLVDDPAQFKYVRLNFSNASYFSINIYFGWDDVAHTGTSLAYRSDNNSYNQRAQLGGDGYYHIVATARMLMVASNNTTDGWGSSSYQGPSGCFERTRIMPWDTPEFGSPPFLWFNPGWAESSSNGYAYAPKLYAKDLTYVASNTAWMRAESVGYTYAMNNPPSGSGQKIPDGQGGFVVPFFPIYFYNPNQMPSPYGEISSLCKIYKIPTGMCFNLETIKKGALDYIAMRTYDSTAMIVVRRG